MVALNATSAAATWNLTLQASVSGPDFTFSINSPYFSFLPIINAGAPLTDLPLPLQLGNPNGAEPHPTGTVTIGATTYDVIYQGGGGPSFSSGNPTVPYGSNPVLVVPATLSGFYLACIDAGCLGPQLELGALNIDLPGELIFHFSTFQPGVDQLRQVEFTMTPEPAPFSLLLVSGLLVRIGRRRSFSESFRSKAKRSMRASRQTWLDRSAARNEDGFARNPARLIGRQKRHWKCDVLRLSRAAQRCFCNRSLLELAVR